MPFLWKYCKKSKTPSKWCYENKLCGQYTWAKKYSVGPSIISTVSWI